MENMDCDWWEAQDARSDDQTRVQFRYDACKLRNDEPKAKVIEICLVNK